MFRSVYPMAWLAISAFGATFSLMMSAWFLDISWLIAALCSLMALAMQFKTEPYQVFRLFFDSRAALVTSLIFAAFSVAADQSAPATTLALVQLVFWLLYEFWYSPLKQADKAYQEFEANLPSIRFRRMSAQTN